jgi:uncharacterized protein YukE
MADGPPYPDPVRFDHGKADEVVTRAHQLIARLQKQTSDRVANATKMRVSWTGPYALQFDREVRRMQSEASSMIGELQTLVTTVTNASTTATTTQQQHDRANQDWWSQQPDPGPVPGL